VQVEDLRAQYDAIIYAVGNEKSRRLGIPGEGIAGCTPASVFVGWYNGHPDYRHHQFDLTGPRAVVIGNGNVALDVARILMQDPEVLARTDIAQHALDALRASKIEQVVLLGRRGPVQASFTPAELKELLDISDVDVVVDPQDMVLDALSKDALEGAATRVRRNVDTLTEQSSRPASKPKQIRFRFLSSPVEVLASEADRVRGLRIERNRLQAAPDGRARVEPTGRSDELACKLVLPAVGYRGEPIAGVPFDESKGRIANVDGRVVEPDSSQPRTGEYVVGWARSGASGLIGSHKSASAEVVAHLLADLGTLDAGSLPPRERIETLLTERGTTFFSFEDWKVLDGIEVERGERRGAVRDKVTEVDEMLRVGGKSGPPTD